MASLYHIREQVYIPTNDPRYLAGTDMENRVEPPPTEVEGDGFDRQRCIVGFNQTLVESQKCLVLGTGGVGQNVGLVLARLGVRGITLVDKDIYEASNFSRQVLGSANDIGRRKVDVAVENLPFHCFSRMDHSGFQTAVEGHHMDALSSWPTIVSLARHSHVIFNCIDVGSVFDFAVNSLSKALEIPLLQGQSASWSFNAEFYSGQPGLFTVIQSNIPSTTPLMHLPTHCKTSLSTLLNTSFHSLSHTPTSTDIHPLGNQCFACTNSIASSFALEGRAYQDIHTRFITWLKRASSEGNGMDCIVQNNSSSSIGQRINASELGAFLSQDRQYRINDSSLTVKAIISAAVQSVHEHEQTDTLKNHKVLSSSSVIPVNADNTTVFTGYDIDIQQFPLFLRRYYELALAELLPGKIEHVPDLLFIPRPSGVPTRYVGSWICPCAAVATIMVSQFVNYITGPTERDPPVSFQMSLASGRTDVCETALECGFVDTPTLSRDTSSLQCMTCANTIDRLEEQLFYSFIPVSLDYCKGQVYCYEKDEDATSISSPSIPPVVLSQGIGGYEGGRVVHEREAEKRSFNEMRQGRLWRNIDHSGEAYCHLALDAVPCKDMIVSCSDRTTCHLINHVSNLMNAVNEMNVFPCEEDNNTDESKTHMLHETIPRLLRIPLVKVKKDHGPLKAFGSGIRSALLRDITVSTQSIGVNSQSSPSSNQNNHPQPQLQQNQTHQRSSRNPCRWYRLKGCGAPDGKGFTVTNVLDDTGSPVTTGTGESTKVIRQIRGAAYPHTCEIEHIMTDRINDLLWIHAGMTTANRPLGRFDYDLGDAIEYPLATRSCSLFESLGDRRLGDHVLRGLELLLPLLFHGPTTIDIVVSRSFHALQSTATMKEGWSTNSTTSTLPIDPSTVDTTTTCSFDPHNIDLDTFDVESLDEYDSRFPRSILLFNGGVNASPDLFADLRLMTNSSPTPPIPGIVSSMDISALRQGFPVHDGTPKQLRYVWDRCCDRITTWGNTPQTKDVTQSNSAPQSNKSPHLYLLHLLSELYWQLGRECGTVGRILHENDVVWGAYRDATGTHMNAHANNFVLLSPSAAMASSSTAKAPSSTSSLSFSPSFLAPLDFDMAYARDNCFFPSPHSTVTTDPDTYSSDLFTQMSDQEFCELGFNLAMCQSNQASTTTGTKSPPAVPAPLGIVRLALRHTLTRGWLTAANGLPDSREGQNVPMAVGTERQGTERGVEREREDMYVLLKLALIMTCQVVA